MTSDTSPESGTLSFSRAVALALLGALLFAAAMVPLHRVLHAPGNEASAPAKAAAGLAQVRHAKVLEAEEVSRALEWGSADPALQTVASTPVESSPFGHTSGKDCDDWEAVFAAERQTGMPYGVIGVDASAQRVSPAPASRYSRASNHRYLARAPPLN
ncbi:MAG TPA: hypothetical protein VFV17_02070 [Usitatibacteraceae bacterium]|nr:hypothetical protein [Usitatibacteraceae bacterium]